MSETIKRILENAPVRASAPCRVDVGGTLDINTFYFPLRHLSPCTVNIAINLRTQVWLLPYTEGRIKISSRGFKSSEYSLGSVPLTHPLGLMFAVIAYFGQSGIHVQIDSASPPKSGLGGSSVAAVGLVAGLLKALDGKNTSKKDIALLAHAIEGSVAGVPCGIQDQLAAVYGGVNAWYWQADSRGPSFKRTALISRSACKDLNNSLLVAYCGIPHESKRINQKWVDQFLAGKNRNHWAEIIECTKRFAHAIAAGNLDQAVSWMNKETAIRRKMTPEVIDPAGKRLVAAAVRCGCGARFTGAGGGGCIWALGTAENISRLRDRWGAILARYPSARLLDAKVDSLGLLVESNDYTQR
ncbi:MAG: galactokinase [Deltaproteobacteria bacterium]|nr:galactokinase [Deltaproteobacteria bacterium]MBW2151476.1 galactokinase [Deltaproteobacteria bacterium]